MEYHFRTDWVFDAPIERVWDIILHVEKWQEWWPSVAQSRAIHIDYDKPIGSKVELIFKKGISYSLKFQIELLEIKPMEYIKGRSTGDLEGIGEWILKYEKNKTYVSYLWNIQTTKPWMNTFAFLLKPVFKFNHDFVMEEARVGIEKMTKN